MTIMTIILVLTSLLSSIQFYTHYLNDYGFFGQCLVH